MSDTDERVTPSWLYEPLREEFHFALDAAASATNRKTYHYCGLDPVTDGPAPHPAWCHGDGLTVGWAELLRHHRQNLAVWLNPPYSRGSLPTWLEKAEAEALAGCTVVNLIPGDTSTGYFHRFALSRQHEVRVLNKRLAFEGAPTDKKGRLAPAKFGSVLIIMRPSHRHWTWL